MKRILLIITIIAALATCAWAGNGLLLLGVGGSSGTHHYLYIDGLNHYLIIDGLNHKLRIDGV